MSCDPVIVVGTGRCGSSAVAGMLHKLGVYMGASLGLKSANNPHGFFEDITVRTLCHALEHRRINLKQFHAHAKRWLQRRRALDRPWGFKCPMIAEHLPHFLGYFDDPKIIICQRDKEDVIRSYEKIQVETTRLGKFPGTRKKTRKELEGMVEWRLWAMRFWLRGYSGLVIKFGDLMLNAEKEARDLVEYCGISPSPEQFENAVNHVRPRGRIEVVHG